MVEQRRDYTAEDLKRLDTLELLRAKPEMFLSPGDTAAKIAARIAEEAFVLTNGPVWLNQVDDWFLIAGQNDWLTAPRHPRGKTDIQKVFRTIIAFPEWGPNSSYGEVLLTAYCEQVVTWLDGKRTVIKGDVVAFEVLQSIVLVHHEWKRVVAFSEFISPRGDSG